MKIRSKIVFPVVLISGLFAMLIVVWWLPRDGIWPFCTRVFANATFLTMHSEAMNSDAMDSDVDTVDAVVSDCGVISYVGEVAEAQRVAGWWARTVDLQGATVTPGFIDAHSHFPLAGLRDITLDLSPPPAGDIDSLDALYAALASNLSKSRDTESWVFGFNYDNTLFAEGRHPDRRALDALSMERPIFLRHNSGHMGVANTKGLAALGVLGNPASAGDPNVSKYPGTFEPNGLLQEQAAPNLQRFIDELSPVELWRLFRSGIARYAGAGYTTVQAGGVDSRAVGVMRRLVQSRLLPLRLVVWPHESAVRNLQRAFPEHSDTDYFTLGPVKIYGDGSPQGYTAFLSRPYFKRLSRVEGYRGYPSLTDTQWRALIGNAIERGWSLAIHTNGDATIDDVLAAVQHHGHERDIDITLIHAQTMRQDQIRLATRLGVEASFFVSHTYHWGDWHRTTSLGPERAATISPLGWADEFGLRYTIHTDAPVTPVSVLDLMWSATERLTRQGHLLGEEQRISRRRALQAVTIAAARQAGLQQHRGSLAVGKVADMAVLSDNPLTAADLRSVRVLRTIVAGRTVFQRARSTPP